MIRMGRSSKPEQSSEPQGQQDVNTSYAPQEYVSSNAANRAMSESESMARDIKEGRLSGFVGYGTKLTGETHFQAMLRVDGHLTGTVASETGTLIIGSSGQVDADISVASALINGTVNGDIIVTERLELGRTARVMGNVQTPRLTIEDGAIFEGGCSMIKAKEAVEKRKNSSYSSSETSSYTTSSVYEDNDTESSVDLTSDNSEEKSESAVN